jgi:hypothetical protein
MTTPLCAPPVDEGLFSADRAAVLSTAAPIIDILLPIAMDVGGTLNTITTERLPPTLGLAPTLDHLTADRLGALGEWWARRAKNHDGGPGDVHARWGILAVPLGQPIMVNLDLVLTYEPTRGRVERIPLQLVFDLSDRKQNAAARMIAEVRCFELVLGPIDRNEETRMIVPGHPTLTTHNGVFIDVGSSFRAMLLSHEAYAFFGQSASREGLFWQVALGHGDLERLPVLTDTREVQLSPGYEHMTQRLELAALSGRGKIIFYFSPIIFNHITGDLLPDEPAGAALAVLPSAQSLGYGELLEPTVIKVPIARMGGRVVVERRTEQRPRQGWRHQSIGMTVQAEPGGPRYISWELAVLWRDLPQSDAETVGEGLLRALIATDKLDDIPPTLWSAILFLCLTAHHEPETIAAWAPTWLRSYGRIERLTGALWMHYLEGTGVGAADVRPDVRAGGDALAEVIGNAVRPGRDTFTAGDAILAIMDIGPRLWRDLAGPSGPTMARLSGGDVEEQRAASLLETLALVAAWRDAPPMPVGSTPADPLDLISRAWAQRRALRGQDGVIIDPDDIAWLCPDTFLVWAPWAAEAVPPPMPAAHTQRIAQLCAYYAKLADEGVFPVVGRYEVVLRHHFPRLAALGAYSLRIAAATRFRAGRDESAVWIRIGPPDSVGGVTLPFRPGAAPPASWLSLLPHAIAWELYLVISACYCDMRAAGSIHVLEQDDHHTSPPGDRRRASGRVVNPRPTPLYVPRRMLVTSSGSRSNRSTTRASYPSAADQEQTLHRLHRLQSVRAHPLNPTRRAKFCASDEKREAWALLDPATRLRVAGQVDFPEHGTIRGLRLIEDPLTGERRAELGYIRGGNHPDVPPRPVISRAHEAAATLLRLLDES